MKRGWRDISPVDRRAALTTAATVPIVHVLLRVAGYRRLKRAADTAAGRWPFGRHTPIDPVPIVNRYRLALSRTRAYSPLPGNCLSRSLTLWFHLRRFGLDPDLRLGVSLDDGAFAAHAWVEWREIVLNDEPDVSDRYRPLLSSRESE